MPFYRILNDIINFQEYNCWKYSAKLKMSHGMLNMLLCFPAIPVYNCRKIHLMLIKNMYSIVSCFKTIIGEFSSSLYCLFSKTTGFFVKVNHICRIQSQVEIHLKSYNKPSKSSVNSLSWPQ